MATITRPLDTDRIGRHSVGYWGAVLAMAVQADDTARADVARAELRRLRCDITRRPRRAKAVQP